MKKILTILISLNICLQTLAQQQETTPIMANLPYDNTLPRIGSVTWGLMGGLNYSSLYGKEIDYIFANNSTTFQMGFHAGIFANTRLSQKYSLKNELIFQHRRVGIDLNDHNNEPYNSKLNMGYVDLMPVNIAYHVGNLELYVGPYISSLWYASLKRRNENGSMARDTDIFGRADNDETKSRYLQKFDFGANAGLEYALTRRIALSARYMHGFTDIFQFANSFTNEDPKTDNIKIYNRAWTVSIKYSLSK